MESWASKKCGPEMIWRRYCKTWAGMGWFGVPRQSLVATAAGGTWYQAPWLRKLSLETWSPRGIEHRAHNAQGESVQQLRTDFTIGSPQGHSEDGPPDDHGAQSGMGHGYKCAASNAEPRGSRRVLREIEDELRYDQIC